jgi:D-alanyl-D-alanine carboxypeptidase
MCLTVRLPVHVACALLLAPLPQLVQAAAAQQATTPPAAVRPGVPRPPAAVVRARVDSLARAFLAGRGAPAVSIQVVRGRDTLVRAGYGMADLEQGVPATAATVYRIGSITKQFTSAAVMRLVEQGRLALDDSIATYLPRLPTAWRPVTVRQLLNHTSGIPSYTDLGERWRRLWGVRLSPDSIVALTAGDSLWFPPGTRWRYDNTGYVLLGMLLDRLTGEPYPTYIERRLLRPLGLEHTWYCDVGRIIPGRARGYERDPDGWRNASDLDMSLPYSAGALCSTVGDLAAWDGLLASGRVVSAASYRAMTTPTGAATAAGYGFGLELDRISGHAAIRHSGGINGFNSANAWFPGDALSVTVLTNSGASRPGPLLEDVARAALGLPLPSPPARVPMTAAERRRYAGRYELRRPDGSRLGMTVLAGSDALMAQADGQPVSELIPIGGRVFRPDFDPTVRLTFDPGEPAPGFTLVQRGVTSRAVRVGALP